MSCLYGEVRTRYDPLEPLNDKGGDRLGFLPLVTGNNNHTRNVNVI